MTKSAKYRMANYDGGLKLHNTAEPSGTLTLTKDFKWELRFDATGQWVNGGMGRFGFDIQDAGWRCCRVILSDVEDTAESATFELPDTPADVLRQELAARQSEAARKNRGSLGSGTIHGLPAGRKRGRFFFDAIGIYLCPNVYGSKPQELLISWSDVTQMDVSGQEASTARTRARGHERKAFHVFREQVKINETTTTPAQTTIALSTPDRRYSVQTNASPSSTLGALGEIMARIESHGPTAGPIAAETPKLIADELAKLAALRDQGVLTDDEFAVEKARLLH
jgi:hypothetical protein